MGVPGKLRLCCILLLSFSQYTLLKASTQAVEISNKCTCLQQHLDKYTHVHVHVALDIKCFYLLKQRTVKWHNCKLVHCIQTRDQILQHLYLILLPFNLLIISLFIHPSTKDTYRITWSKGKNFIITSHDSHILYIILWVIQSFWRVNIIIWCIGKQDSISIFRYMYVERGEGWNPTKDVFNPTRLSVSSGPMPPKQI